ncbi:MAG: MFS transporter [Butyrivibrio sp.]|nr:MFS transporter [Butyrivibrio sp.]
MAGEIKYRDVLKDKEYRKYLFSGLINRFGDSIDAIAFTWLVYQITHSASWAAIIFGLNVVPNIVVQPLAGPIVEKLDKKKVIVFSHLARGFVISAFVLMYLMGIVNPYIMIAFTLIITTIESINMPAGGAFIPQIVRKEKLAHAMSLSSTLSSAIQLVGTGVAGVIIAQFGVQTAMLIDAATFFIAAFGVMSVKTIEQEKAAAEENAAVEAKATLDKDNAKAKESYLDSLKDGFSYIAHNHAILNVCLVAVFMNFFIVPINALEAPMAEEIFGLGSELLSIAGMAAAIGGIVGAIIIPKLMEKLSVKMVIVLGGLVIGGFLYLISMGSIVKGQVIPAYIWVGVCYFMMLVSATVVGGSVSIQFTKTCDRDYLARAGAVLGAVSVAAMPIGSFIVSIVSVYVSPAFLLGISGILLMILVVIVAVSKMDFEIVKKEVADAT